MKTETEADPESVNARLAKYLETQKEAILGEWREWVRGDVAIMSTMSLNPSALTNRLPLFLDDLTTSLRRYGSRPVADQTARNAGEHGATRYGKSYEIPEVLREMLHLRSLLVYHLRIFEDLNPDVGMASALFASTTVHSFLDEVAIDAVRQFLGSKLDQNDEIQWGPLTGEEAASIRSVADGNGSTPRLSRANSEPEPSAGFERER